jgi:hypothetical protein
MTLSDLRRRILAVPVAVLIALLAGCSTSGSPSPVPAAVVSPGPEPSSVSATTTTMTAPPSPTTSPSSPVSKPTTTRASAAAPKRSAKTSQKADPDARNLETLTPKGRTEALRICAGLKGAERSDCIDQPGQWQAAKEAQKRPRPEPDEQDDPGKTALQSCREQTGQTTAECLADMREGRAS